MNNIECEFLSLDNCWDKEVQNHTFDIYHLSGWLKSSSAIDGGEAKGLMVKFNNKNILFPLIARKLDNDYWDATSTYGFGGPLGESKFTVEELDILLEFTLDFLKKEKCVSWFLRLNPILNKDWNSSIGTLVEHGPTLSSDLTKTEEEHWSETQNQHRRGIKKAIKSGVEIEISSLNEENCIVFSKIYAETMRHLNASKFYFFDDSYFLKLAKNLSERLILVTAYYEGLAISSSIYSHCKESGIMQYHLGGTLNDYRNLQPAKLITHKAIEWGRQNDYKTLHLGGGLGAQRDSLYSYKKGFSSNEHLFKTHRFIVDYDKYKDLLEVDTRIDILDGFFPLYRL